MNNPNVEPKYVEPFKKICMTIGELPTAYLETMSYYEMLVWFVEFLKNKVIPTVNQNAEAVQELQQLYVELKNYVDNYFESTDFQAMVNEKIDEMVEDGTLENLLNNALSLIKVYSTTIEMIEDYSNIVVGMNIKTLGYYEINDGGGAFYKITDTASESDYQISLSENLYATLIEDKKNTINVLQLGAYSDGSTDNTDIFNNIIDFANSTLKNIYFPEGKYLVNYDLHNINGCISLYGDISGEGQREHKATIYDNRNSNNYLLNFNRYNDDVSVVKGGAISYLNFVDNKLNTNKCILITDSINYLGNINNCNFLDYAVGLYVDGSHGFVLDTCAFVRCGGKVANSDDFALMIDETTDVSINNCCIDHTRYQMWVNGASMVYITNTHFEISKKHIVKGKQPIYCLMGNYGYISFTNCSFINLSYKEWIESADYTINNCIHMIYASYASFVNCMFSCGRGSGQSISEYTKQAKYVSLYYGSIDNCKIKSPAYMTNAFNLNQSTFINNHIQCDIEEEDFEMEKNKHIIDSVDIRYDNNHLQYAIPTQEPQTYPTNYPMLCGIYNNLYDISSSKSNIRFNKRIPYADIQNVNTIRLQSKDMLFGAYHLKIYSIGETKLFYDGYIRINTDKTIQEISHFQKSFGSNNKIKIFSDDDSNDVYIQILEPIYKTNTIVFDMENLTGHSNLLIYYDNQINTELTYENKLDLSL